MYGNEEIQFLEQIIIRFSQGYKQVLTHLIVQIFKEANDDRFHKFVPVTLRSVSSYLL
jgi:hypothetical protein